jgi:hypothetical protein
MKAVQCPRQDAGTGGFTNATRTREEVGMVNPLHDDGIFQGCRNMFLTNYVFEA